MCISHDVHYKGGGGGGQEEGGVSLVPLLLPGEHPLFSARSICSKEGLVQYGSVGVYPLTLAAVTSFFACLGKRCSTCLHSSVGSCSPGSVTGNLAITVIVYKHCSSHLCTCQYNDREAAATSAWIPHYKHGPPCFSTGIGE